jgi:hypothetical protein
MENIMTDKQPDTFDLLLADLMLRVTVIEKILIDKGIIAKEEYITLIEDVAKKAANAIIEQAKIFQENKN